MTQPKFPSFPTAAQAIATIQTWDNLTPVRRRSLVTAVNTYCRLGGPKPPATVRLDPARCLPEIDAASFKALGISAKSLANVRAGLRATFRRLGLLAPVRRRVPVTDPHWASLIEKLPARFHPHRLRAFMEYCAATGVEPDAVNVDTLVAYLDHRVATQGGDNNRSDVREVARQWNKAAATLAGWPSTELALPPTDRPRALPFSAYPPSLQAQLEFVFDACGQEPEGEWFGPENNAHETLSAASIETHRKSLRLLLWGMVETGTPVESIDSLAPLFRKDVLQKVFTWHLKRLGGKPTAGLASMAATVHTLAARTGLSVAERESLRELLAKARRKRQTEITPRNAALLDRFEDPVVRGELLDLPAVLMTRAREQRDGWTTPDGVNHPAKPMEACWTAAVAAALEIELNLPLRIHDLAHLRLGDQLRLEQDSRRRPVVHLRVVAHKNGRLVETVLSGHEAELLREYLQDFRPLGPHPETSWVFPNRDSPDRPRAKGAFSETICGEVELHTGLGTTVQAFRCFAAAMILEDNPHALDDVRSMLGHSGFEMAMRHYRRSNRLGAGKRLRESLAKNRRASRLTVAAARMQIALLGQRRRRV